MYEDRDYDPADYKSPRSSMPKWMKRVTKMYPNRHEVKRGLVYSLGWELRPDKRCYTTCVVATVYKTEYRR